MYADLFLGSVASPYHYYVTTYTRACIQLRVQRCSEYIPPGHSAHVAVVQSTQPEEGADIDVPASVVRSKRLQYGAGQRCRTSMRRCGTSSAADHED